MVTREHGHVLEADLEVFSEVAFTSWQFNKKEVEELDTSPCGQKLPSHHYCI
jgi:hypothetical protein